MDYIDFLQQKIKIAEKQGFEFDDSVINPVLKPHNKLMVKWLVEGGRRACFASFGLHKTVTQLETVRCTLLNTGGMGLIICPLGVRQEFKRDAVQLLKWDREPKFIRSIEETEGDGIYITNYETVRDGKLDPAHFMAVSLDEASVLRGLGGSKTFREFMRLFTGDAGPKGDRKGKERVPYRFVATATPSPNDYIELLAYADFLGIMDVSQAKTRFFKRDSTKNDNLTLHPHKEEEFWLWVASWALFVSQPSDLTGNPEDDKGYDLPPIEVHWHEVATDHSTAGVTKSGQMKLVKDTQLSAIDTSREKKESLHNRIEKMLELRKINPDAHRIIWHDLEVEREAIERALPEAVSIYGKQDLEKREQAIIDFSDGKIKEFAAKPIIAGSGCNFQRHCHWAIYLGIGFKFNDFIQSVHRLQRFLQTETVRVDLIYTEAESNVKRSLERKWEQHNNLVQNMTKIIKKYGLSHAAMANELTRKMGIERIEVSGEKYNLVQHDNVPEMKSKPSDSVGFIMTSWPFSNQYEYSPNYADFGHCDSNNEFFKQMDYLTPEAFRVLMPGRVAAIHVKDRIVPGGITDLGFQTVYPFHMDAIMHMTKHGFAFIGMKTIVTDVVRENKQTNRLGWSEQCKDGSRMGVGMSEYLLLFRKPQTDRTRGYADVPVVKDKGQYSRARWQVDAHGFSRSSGNRCLTPEELKDMDHKQIFREFKEYSLSHVYDFEHHVKIGETLDLHGKLPSAWMLMHLQSWDDSVWADVTRMLTLNGSQWSNGKEMHICPLQFDIVDRAITQFSNEGDIVLDYFGGLMTVPYRAILLNRIGHGIELNPAYFLDGVQYCKAAEQEVSMPSLFDTLNIEAHENNG